MLDLAGLQLTDEEKPLLLHPWVGGVIFFARNYQSPSQLQDLVAEIRDLREDLLLAVDQEGGRVQRFDEGFTRLPPMQAFLSGYHRDPQATLALVEDVGWLLAAEVLACGVDFSFAPVLDVDDDHCSVIADRAFSARPEEVTALAGALIAGMHDAGMAVTGKHFPGHGAVTADSHLELPVDERDWHSIAQRDLPPFRALMPSLDGIMPAHIVFPRLAPDPVGFSRFWLQQKLRDELGFNGVIFSDDLAMAGAASAGDFGDRADKALAAGCDMVLVCNDRAGALTVLERLARQTLQPSPRLGTMRARQSWDWGRLQASERWQMTRETLAAFVVAS